MHFIEWKYINFIYDFTEIVHKSPIKKIPALAQIMKGFFSKGGSIIIFYYSYYFYFTIFILFQHIYRTLNCHLNKYLAWSNWDCFLELQNTHKRKTKDTKGNIIHITYIYLYILHLHFSFDTFYSSNDVLYICCSAVLDKAMTTTVIACTISSAKPQSHMCFLQGYLGISDYKQCFFDQLKLFKITWKISYHLTLAMLNLFKKHENIFVFSIISELWDDR